jgi:hypothetical protein
MVEHFAGDSTISNVSTGNFIKDLEYADDDTFVIDFLYDIYL